MSFTSVQPIIGKTALSTKLLFSLLFIGLTHSTIQHVAYNKKTVVNCIEYEKARR